MSKTIVLDFGPSTYERHSPHVSADELKHCGKVHVPEKLPFSIKEYIKGIVSIGSSLPNNYMQRYQQILDRMKKLELTLIIGRPTVILPVHSVIIEMCGSEGSVDHGFHMMWIEERKEWIGIGYTTWLESDSWGNDQSYSGPYALDDYHAKRILEAFDIKSEEFVVKLNDILYTSPEKIKKLGLKK